MKSRNKISEILGQDEFDNILKTQKDYMDAYYQAMYPDDADVEAEENEEEAAEVTVEEVKEEAAEEAKEEVAVEVKEETKEVETKEE